MGIGSCTKWEKKEGEKKGRKKAQVITQKERKVYKRVNTEQISINYHYLHHISAPAGQEPARSRSCTHQTLACNWAKLFFTFSYCFYLKIFFSVRIHYITALRIDLWGFF